MSTCNLWFLLGRNEKRGSLFLNLLRNILSCYLPSAFEFILHPIPFIGTGWKDVEHNHTLRGTLPLHLFLSSDKGWPQRNQVWEGEFSVLSPTYHVLSLWNVLTLLVMPYDILQNSFTHENFLLDLGLSIHLQAAWQFKTSVPLLESYLQF